MVYEINNIMKDVRIAMDENKTNEQLLSDEDIDTLTLDEIIRSKIVEAVRRTIINAPLHLLDGGVPFGDAVYWRDQASGWILLPDDFLRLVLFKMSDWERPVYEPITAADPQYQLQFSRYKGLRGNPQKPVVAIVNRAEGRVLELYSCKNSEATVEQAVYIPRPEEDENGGIIIPLQCYNAVVYMAAAMTCAAVGNTQLSQILNEHYKTILV